MIKINVGISLILIGIYNIHLKFFFLFSILWWCGGGSGGVVCVYMSHNIHSATDLQKHYVRAGIELKGVPKNRHRPGAFPFC